MVHLSQWIMLLQAFGETENQEDLLWDFFFKEKATVRVLSVIVNDTEEFSGNVREKMSKTEQIYLAQSFELLVFLSASSQVIPTYHFLW